MLARISSVAVQAFRSFAGASGSVEFASDLTIVWGPNSQGKTALAEAIEFLLTGELSRKELLGSAAREFAGSLRNVFAKDDVPTVVSATLLDLNGKARRVVRTMDADYGARHSCSSAVTVDGVDVEDLESVGISLAPRPIRIPLLLQHNIRFVLSARPQERTDYFKSVLEVQDLEDFRDLVRGCGKAASVVGSPTFDSLKAALVEAGLSELADDLRGEIKARTLKGILLDLLNTLVPDGGEYKDLAVAVEAVGAYVATEREAQFPLSALSVPKDDPVMAAPESDFYGPLERLAELNEAIDEAEVALLQLYEVALTVPGVADAAVAIDCPLCDSEGSLTVERIALLKERLREAEEYQNASSLGKERLGAYEKRLDTISEGLRQSMPEALSWTEAIREEKGVTAEGIEAFVGPESGAPDWTRKAEHLDHTAGIVQEKLSEAQRTIPESEGELSFKIVDDLKGAFEEVTAAGSTFSAALGEYRRVNEEVSNRIREVVDARRGLSKLSDATAICRKVADLEAELESIAEAEALTAAVEGAIEDIDVARQQVLEEKFAELGGEISKWWGLLRPDEAVRFDGLESPGAGRRYIDLKAGLRSGSDAARTVLRDAVAVFSDSQLNCLGLAAFLARASSDGHGFVILDDPLQASDTDHRAAFVEKVPAELVDAGLQVVVLTHDEGLQRDLQDRYQHLDLRVYQVTMDDPKEGSILTRTRDSLDVLLARAAGCSQSNDLLVRKRCAGILRDATERLCKAILVNARRKAGEEVQLSEYDGMTAGELQPLADPYLVQDPSHAGKLRVIVHDLNPGNHDDVAPPKQTLRVALGNLKMLRQQYL